ncbi:hypothetical protein EW026_g2643 [Hermanssonia centrifuga]|uniref:ferric-chelate reductase (NADPH) n=1 Tax=Hermanssonia centrifuga TaxID=98765 RepID=A0A4S4KN95_9APHY|nr:hypothetical protein EW026_g2643 [Hermanssonia centrifuga]
MSTQSNLTFAPIPDYPNDVEWVTAYLVQRILSDSTWVYAWILWIAIAVIFFSYSAMRWAGLRGGYIGAVWSKWSLRRRTWRKKHSLAVALKLGRPHTQPESLPSNAQILCLLALVVGSLLLAFVGPDYLAPGSRLWTLQNYPKMGVEKRGYPLSDFYFLQPQFTIEKMWWTTGGRTGLIAFALFPLTVLLALKAPPFAIFSIPQFTHLCFDKLAFLHRWCGVLTWFLTTLHVIFWSVQLAIDHRATTGENGYFYAWQYEKFHFAWAAYGFFTLLMLCSLPPIRRHYYEVFWFLHILFVPSTLIMSALHHPPLWWWCWAALALWVGERSYRLTWWLNTNGFLGGIESTQSKPRKRVSFTAEVTPDTLPMHVLGQANAVGKLPVLPRINPALTAPFHHTVAMTGSTYVPPPGFVHAELLPGRTVRVRLVTPGYLSWAPGQHFLINIPAISKFTSHPFTVASVCDSRAHKDAGRELVFFIRAKKGWTKDLWDTVARLTAHGLKYPNGEKLPSECQMPDRGVLMRGFIDGPFGSAARAKWGDHSTVLLVAGGSGVSFALSVLEYMCMCMAGRDGRELGGQPGGWGRRNFRTTRVRFVWLVREFGHIHWCAPFLRRCMSMVPSSELQIDIFVTNAKPAMRSLPPPIIEVSDPDAITEIPLSPPSPHFTRNSLSSPKPKSEKKRHSASTSIVSVETEDDDDNDSVVDLSYYTSDVADEEKGELGHDEHVLDLTNFEGDDDTALPEAAAREEIRLELDEEEIIDISVVAERARAGRPVISRILADEVEQSKGPIIVGCCGPTSLNAVVRKSIAAQINPSRIWQGDERGHIALVAEDFGY